MNETRMSESYEEPRVRSLGSLHELTQGGGPGGPGGHGGPPGGSPWGPPGHGSPWTHGSV